MISSEGDIPTTTEILEKLALFFELRDCNSRVLTSCGLDICGSNEGCCCRHISPSTDLSKSHAYCLWDSDATQIFEAFPSRLIS